MNATLTCSEKIPLIQTEVKSYNTAHCFHIFAQLDPSLHLCPTAALSANSPMEINRQSSSLY